MRVDYAKVNSSNERGWLTKLAKSIKLWSLVPARTRRFVEIYSLVRHKYQKRVSNHTFHCNISAKKLIYVNPQFLKINMHVNIRDFHQCQDRFRRKW